jgi:hypothetical protein
MSTGKNPFEIRFDLLALAKDYLDQQTAINLEFARKVQDTVVTEKHVGWEKWEQYVPKMYTFDEVTKKAEELYKFVSKK